LTALALACILQTQDPPDPVTGIARMVLEAEAVSGHVDSELARNFLSGAKDLPGPTARAWYFRRKDDGVEYRSEAQYQGMSVDERKNWTRRDLTEDIFYNTKYGTPLAYARLLDVAALKGMTNLEGKRVVDFGYGTIGHLRLMASMGAEAVGVDVDPFLDTLYGDPNDTNAKKGKIELLRGFFPTDGRLVTAMGRYDVFTSKNTLKKGYIHPSREAKPEQMVSLGVDDETFLKTVFNGLKPGGYVVIYNICGAKAKENEPFNPSAEGENPFPKELWEKVGFKTLAYDEVDSPTIRKMGEAFGWGKPAELETTFFSWYSVFQKPD
jgi:hypothetical protein